ncbi:hypothetical protein MRB53_034883 [Persea americana]|uniref:Uncharacterized protein n=1 Tax=Persea americana TaxID=3435 RepID=A0ACC2K324_PERAE|nr:hypothetical protein MRB53_034883 [Persea americana]
MEGYFVSSPPSLLVSLSFGRQNQEISIVSLNHVQEKQKAKSFPALHLHYIFVNQSKEKTQQVLLVSSLLVVVLISIFFPLCRGGNGEKTEVPLPHLSRSNRSP